MYLWLVLVLVLLTFFKTEFLCGVLAVLELTLESRLVSKSRDQPVPGSGEASL